MSKKPDILNSDDEPTTELAKNNKIVKLQLTAEELELKKQERLVIAKKVKQYRTQIQALSALYPKCFTPNPKPLAIGLDKIIIVNEELKPEAERMSKTSIKKFLGVYTSKYKYLQSCTLGAARIDLEGNEVAVLDQEAVDFAKEKLANCKAWQNKCNAWKQAISKVKNQNNARDKAINKIKLQTKETK
jgi:ProP effector